MARPAALFQRRGRQGSDAGWSVPGVALRRDSATGISSRHSSPSSVAQTISVSVLTHARSVRSRRACAAKHACCALARCAQARENGIEIPRSITLIQRHERGLPGRDAALQQLLM